jgi:hypothetical protein
VGVVLVLVAIDNEDAIGDTMATVEDLVLGSLLDLERRNPARVGVGVVGMSVQVLPFTLPWLCSSDADAMGVVLVLIAVDDKDSIGNTSTVVEDPVLGSSSSKFWGMYMQTLSHLLASSKATRVSLGRWWLRGVPGLWVDKARRGEMRRHRESVWWCGDYA